MEVTRRSVLSDALRYRETVMKQFSRNGMGLVPRTGMQEEFERYRQECRILRELIQALEYEPVRAAIAEFLEREEEEPRDWQREVMAGKKRTGLFAPEAGADYRLVPPEA